MIKLPGDIWRHIYEYDPTFHDIYDTMKKEFFLKTPYWRMKWLNRDMDYHGAIDQQDKFEPHDFRSHYSSIHQLTDYWNETYHEPPWSPPKTALVNCEAEFITDCIGNSSFLFDNLKMLRHYYYNYKSHNLYKPAKKNLSKHMRCYNTKSR
tara:strand:- start:22 stop:474 length:453 start_codon:yes stop_codon:yes gene_type:complete